MKLFNHILVALLLTTSSVALAEMDHSKMDHGAMKMDHSTMDMKGMSAVGMPAKGAKPDKVVHVILSDDNKITFKKDVQIESNDVVQFVIMNTGKNAHNFTIGSAEEQRKHRQMMANMGDNNDHDTGSSVTVAPGKAKQILWHFHGDNNVVLSCNMPGHSEAGMTKTLTL
ncbi:copper-resistant cuproprotein CopI [Photobacterium leiognathi]|uniref:copper-resistant cuproprotein CopI n=1 Tax=Photobacterium leiognathi TaxID=553611 RepID=UPI002980E2C8|nr:copper-binding protein [Photobacterium leiognathi]